MLLTVKEVAQRLNVSQSCIYQLVETGKIPHHRIGTGRGAIRFSEANIESFLCDSQHHSCVGQATPRPARQKLKHLEL